MKINILAKWAKRSVQGVGFVGLALVGIATQNTDDFEIAKNLEIFSNVYREIHTYYVDELEPEKVMRSGLNAMLNSLDPYTTYISREEVEQFQSSITGKYGGVGATVAVIGDKPVVTEIYENSPAQKAGLLAGDMLMVANNKPLSGKTIQQVTQELRGTPKSSIVLEVKRGSEPTTRKLTIVRDEILVPNIPYAGVLNGNTAYIVLSTFSENAGRNVAKTLAELKQNNKIDNVILDLRGNTGGLLNEAVNVANVFLPKNQLVVQIKGRDIDQQQNFQTLNNPIDIQSNLVILIDNSSASASEIVAGAIQDLDRGVVVGERSYGKGLVQNTYNLSFGAKLKITTARYYIPSGRCIQATQYKDGKPVAIADSLRTTFKTKRGRKVYDGGGILPDIATTDETFKKLVQSLYSQRLIFDFATDYRLNNANVPTAKEFKLANKDFDNFMAFLNKRSYTYKTDTDKLLADLETKAKEEKYYDLIKSDLDVMRKTVEADKYKLLETYRAELLQLLQSEIVRRYYFERGALENGTVADLTLQKAVALFSNVGEFNKILVK